MSVIEILCMALISLALVVMIGLLVIAWVSPKRLVQFFFKEVGDRGEEVFVCWETEEQEQGGGEDES